MKFTAALAIANKMMSNDLRCWAAEGLPLEQISAECEWHDRSICELVGRKLTTRSLTDIRNAYEQMLRARRHGRPPRRAV